MLGQLEAKPVVALAGASPEAAAVDAQHRGKRAIVVLRPSQVELHVLVVWVGVLDVRLEDHPVRNSELDCLLCGTSTGCANERENSQQPGEACGSACNHASSFGR